MLGKLFPSRSNDANIVKFRLDPDVTHVDAENLLLLFPRYLSHCAANGVKSNAVASYVQQLRPFVAWFEAHAPGFNHRLTPDRLEQFAEWLHSDYRSQYGSPLSHNSRAATLKRLRTFFTWAFKTNRVEVNLSAWVPTLTEKPRTRRPLHDGGLVRLLEAAGQGRKRHRDRALIALLAGTGMRRGECFHLRIEQFEFHADGSGSCWLSTTKNDKPRTAVFDRTTGRLVLAYMDSRGCDTGPLWTFQRIRSMWDVVNRCAQRAGLPMMGPHDLRKLFVTNWYKAYPRDDGRAEFFLKLQIGHAPANVTQRHYALLTSEDIRQFFVSPMEAPEIAVFVDGL